MQKILIFSVLTCLTLIACEPTPQSKVSKQEEINKCVNRGISYFKEIGSYPTLNSDPNKGRKAEEVALERCKRTTTAF